jgi:hypothetical protein
MNAREMKTKLFKIERVYQDPSYFRVIYLKKGWVWTFGSLEAAARFVGSFTF